LEVTVCMEEILVKSGKPNNKPHAGTIMAIVFSLYLFLAMFMAVSCYGQAREKRSEENLAPLAIANGSGKDQLAAIDGVKQQDGRGEWVGGSPNAWYGWISYPKLELEWKSPREINKVVLYDRATAEEHMAACILKFSDNSEVHVVAVPNDGSPKAVVFEPRTVTGMTLMVVDGVGKNIGLSELEVYYDPAAQPQEKRKRSFTDYVSYLESTEFHATLISPV